MPKQLDIAEMVEVARQAGIDVDDYVRALEFAGDQLGKAIAEKLGVDFGCTDVAHPGMAGFCGCFFAKPGIREMPAAFDEWDPNGDWEVRDARADQWIEGHLERRR